MSLETLLPLFLTHARCWEEAGPLLKGCGLQEPILGCLDKSCFCYEKTKRLSGVSSKPSHA